MALYGCFYSVGIRLHLSNMLPACLGCAWRGRGGVGRGLKRWEGWREDGGRWDGDEVGMPGCWGGRVGKRRGRPRDVPGDSLFGCLVDEGWRGEWMG